MTTKMQTVQRRTKDIQGLRFLSISTDPVVDSTKVLKKYVKDHKIDESNWRLLRGDKKVIVDLAVKGFKLSADQKSAVHSQKFVLVDRKGMIRGYYDSEVKEELARLESDIRTLSK